MPDQRRRTRRAAARSSPQAERRLPRRTLSRAQHFVVGGLLLAAAFVFAPAIRSPYLFDDVDSVVQNQSIDRLWPLSIPLNPPPATPVTGRPVVNLAFALNRAVDAVVSDDAVPPGQAGPSTGYHIGNIALHLLTSLIVLGLLIRTIDALQLPERRQNAVRWIAILVVALWTLHPLQTSAVDYITQRTELLVSLFYVATLYAAARWWSATTPRTRFAWAALAVLASLLGMGSKEVMITAPIAVMLYDVAFHGEPLRRDRTLRRSRIALYAALLLTAVPLVVSVFRGSRADSVGFHLGVTWYQYLYTQCWAVARYLQLVAWPARLTFDYGQRPIAGWAGAPGAVLLAGLLAATVLAWRRSPRLGFVGIWFFLLLLPSSSIVPIRTEIADERRMYLALLPAIVALVLSGVWLAARLRATGSRARKLLVAGATIVVALLGAVTAIRSSLYANPEALWRDTIAKRPTNARAYDQLGATVLAKDSTRTAEARELFATAIITDSTYAYGWTDLAAIEMRLGRPAQAQALLEHVLLIIPGFVDATRRLAVALLTQHDAAHAVPLLEHVAQAQPTPETLGELATAYNEAGRPADAVRVLDRLLAIDPTRQDVFENLIAILLDEHRADLAIARLQQALRSDSTADLLTLLTAAEAQAGDANAASVAAAAAAARTDRDPAMLAQLAESMMQVRRADDAIGYLTRALALVPGDPDLTTRLAIAEADAGRIASARARVDSVIAAHPDYRPAREVRARLGGR